MAPSPDAPAVSPSLAPFRQWVDNEESDYVSIRKVPSLIPKHTRSIQCPIASCVASLVVIVSFKLPRDRRCPHLRRRIWMTA
eukprot:3935396-Rhodomonas_salina.4